jgi:cellular nucleic acid-binding protein
VGAQAAPEEAFLVQSFAGLAHRWLLHVCRAQIMLLSVSAFLSVCLPAGGFVPAVYAQRGPQFWGDEHSNRKASRHVDEFQRQQCHTCGQEGHWAATCPQGGATACFQCGEEGHLARDCPQGPLKCFQCGQDGHLARDCPQGQVKCFQCGEEGHFVRDCPKGPLKCYKCGEEGHLARDCLAPEKCHRCVCVGDRASFRYYVPVGMHLTLSDCVCWAFPAGRACAFLTASRRACRLGESALHTQLNIVFLC